MLTPAAPAKIDTRLWALPFAPPEWALTPPAVPAHVQRLQQRVYQREPQVETLPGRVERTSHTASKPPSSASPFHKPPRKPRAAGGPRGARPGHPGHGPTLLRPTAVRLIAPAPCACGHGALLSLAPSYPPPSHRAATDGEGPPPLRLTPRHLCGWWHTPHSPRAPRASGRRWPTRDGPHRRTRRQASDLVAPGPRLLPLRLAYAAKLGGRANNAHPRGASARAPLRSHRHLSPAGARGLHG
jgi:Family of unknown function (DUF6444)